MRLFNLDHSPYAARIKIQILQKGLPIDIVLPPATFKTPEFLTHFPLGKIPLLELDDGSYLPESTAIMQYIEEMFPSVPCQPTTVLEKAHMRVMMSYTDTHLGPALLPFFKAMLLPDFVFDPDQQVKLVVQTLTKIDCWIAKNDPLERDLHLGDMTLRPTIWYVHKILPKYTSTDPITSLPYLSQWLLMVDKNEHVQTAMRSMEVAFNAFNNRAAK